MAHFLKKQLCFRVGALVCWLWETTLFQKVVGWNPGTVYWLDIEFFTLICCRNCILCLKRPKINKKEPGVGPLKDHLGLRILDVICLPKTGLFNKNSFSTWGDCQISLLWAGTETGT